jgi:g-D-glutamyl-meso-diaminopimelate peptidase
MIWDHKAVIMAAEAMKKRFQEVEITPLTRSILGKEIPLITLGTGKKAVLYVGTHRGTDSITSGILLDFAADYLAKREIGATMFEYPMSYLFQERKIYVLPMLNPDGADYVTHGLETDNPLHDRILRMEGSADMAHWRGNARGVDLHHNYDAGFFDFHGSAGSKTLVGGEFPESEPETAALARFLRLKREEILGVLSLHTAGEALVCTCNDNLSAKTMAVGRVISRMTGYRLERPEAVNAYGSLADWCIAKLGRPAFTVLCGRGEEPLPDAQRPLIYERLRRTLFSLPCMV